MNPDGEYNIEYSTDDGETWNEYDPNEGIPVPENEEIKVRLTDGINTGDEITIEVDNIDKTKPTNTVPTATATTDTITVTNNQTDEDSGIKVIKYQIKKHEEGWEDAQEKVEEGEKNGRLQNLLNGTRRQDTFDRYRQGRQAGKRVRFHALWRYYRALHGYSF